MRTLVAIYQPKDCPHRLALVVYNSEPGTQSLRDILDAAPNGEPPVRIMLGHEHSDVREVDFFPTFVLYNEQHFILLDDLADFGGTAGTYSGQVAFVFAVTSARPFMADFPNGRVELHAGALLLTEAPPWADPSSFPHGYGFNEPTAPQVTLTRVMTRMGTQVVATYHGGNAEVTSQGTTPGEALAALGEAVLLSEAEDPRPGEH